MYTIDLTPTADRLYAEQLPALIDLYLVDVERRNQTKTAVGYRAKLRFVTDWWHDAGPGFGWMLGAGELADLNRYLDAALTISGTPLSYNSRRDALRRLSQCLRWAYERRYVPIDLSSDVPAARGMEPTRRPVELTALRKMLAAAHEGDNPGRDVALVATLAGTGIRCEECAALRVRDVMLYADASGYAVLPVTKFDKPRTVGIDSTTGAHLRPWIDILQEPDRPLFPSRKGAGKRPLSPGGVYKLIVRLAEKSGTSDQIQGAHDLRRMFATLWMRRLPGKGYGELLQQQMGHANFATTQKYSLQDVDYVLQVMRERPVSPMAQLAEHLQGATAPEGRTP